MKAFFRKLSCNQKNAFRVRTGNTKGHDTKAPFSRTHLALASLFTLLLLSCVNTVETDDKNGIGSYKFPEATAVSGKYTSQVYLNTGTSVAQLETTYLENWENIPFLSMDEFFKFVSLVNSRGWKLEKNNSVYTYKYNSENAAPEHSSWPEEWNEDQLCFDIEKQTIYSDNFVRIITDTINLNNGIGISGVEKTDKACTKYPKIQDSSLTTQIQPKEKFSFDLSKYDLKMFVIDDTVYLPIQALAPLFCVYITCSFSAGDYFLDLDTSDKTFNTGKAYFCGAKNQKTRSKLLAEYNYRTLCILFDTSYALKEQRTQFGKSNITYFNDEFFKAGTGFDILSTDTDTYEKALIKFLMNRIDDGHTAYNNASLLHSPSEFYYYYNLVGPVLGDRYKNLMITRYMLRALREKANGKPGVFYVQENGTDKLAVLSYDGFYDGEAGKTTDLSKLAEQNTYAFLRASFDDIAKHSSVQNVVFDVSCNGGGAVINFLLNLLFLNKSASVYLPVKNYIDNSVTKFFFTVEDENGKELVKSGYNFYVLTSEFSFSCANALAAQCKYQNLAKIIGKQSGGGAAMVKFTQTADGALFQTSSALEMCVLDSEGNYICIDGGVPVDLEISYENFYSGETTYQNLYEILKKEYAENF